jgi:acetyl-CoA carboxylase carboxyl transferase subunit alpha
MNYLDFEKPIEELFEQLEKIKQVAEKSGVDVSKTIADIEEKIFRARTEIYGNPSRQALHPGVYDSFEQ